MINPGFILFPLYLYPLLPTYWTPLFNAANTYPDLSFLVVVNIDNGPGASACPNSDYTPAIHNLSLYPNIVALGYVHTASSYNCGASGTDICPATRPQADLRAEIDTYQKWSLATTAGGCGSPTIRVNGIFFDEAPTVAANLTYMENITTYARNSLTNGNTIVYNPGSPVDQGYYQFADYINVFENTAAIYHGTNIPPLANGHANQSTLLIHTDPSDLQTLEQDVDTIIDTDSYGFAGVMITNRTVTENPWSGFPSYWDSLCKDVDAAN
ncbi:hypothetical protein MMC07_005394 [Pseudocyphellaria aurata]|nr:hypothetical protein [Pseudocyphellaria aurata]